MAKDKQDYQVIIIGGGPAGIATSLTLTSRGVSNCIVEAQLEPIRKEGEAIPPSAKPLFQKLGIMQLLDHPNHQVYYGNKSAWGTEVLEEKEFIKGFYGHGYLLDRLHFEKQLRQHLNTHAGHFLEGYKLKKVIQKDQGVSINIENNKHKRTLQANYIVDATGRKSAVCKQLGIEKRTIDTQFTISFKATLRKPVAHQISVEATENGWWYAAPLHNNELTLQFFTIQALIPNKNERPLFLSKELEKSIHISKIIEGASLDFSTIKIMPTGTSRLDVPYGDYWIAVGDAAFSFDPISSYGITSALGSGFYAGHALASQLLKEEDAMTTYRYVLENTFEVYLEKLRNHYALEHRWKEKPYWKNRLPIVASAKKEIKL